jgi:single-stranded-DNA-specific exonuclease
VVTDHHLPGDALPPAAAVLDPRRPDCPSADKDLCGTGVAFKLAQALGRELGLSPNLPLHFLDYVALATVADVVPLAGENRILVRHGLKLLAGSRWAGLAALVETAGLRGKPLRAGHVGFILGPRLNAAGRIGDAMDGLRLLLSDDPAEAATLARALETLNTRRQQIDQRILAEAVDLAEATLRPDDRALVLASDGWHPAIGMWPRGWSSSSAVPSSWGGRGTRAGARAARSRASTCTGRCTRWRATSSVTAATRWRRG